MKDKKRSDALEIKPTILKSCLLIFEWASKKLIGKISEVNTFYLKV